MKKFLTIANLAKCVAFICGIAAFCLMFADQLAYTAETALGKTTFTIGFQNALFGGDVDLLIFKMSVKGAILSFIGYAIIAVAALLTAANFFVTDKSANKFLPIINGILMIVGGVFILLEASIFNSANDVKAIVWGLAAGPIIAAILAFIGGLLNCCSGFLPSKK